MSDEVDVEDIDTRDEVEDAVITIEEDLVVKKEGLYVAAQTNHESLSNIDDLLEHLERITQGKPYTTHPETAKHCIQAIKINRDLGETILGLENKLGSRIAVLEDGITNICEAFGLELDGELDGIEVIEQAITECHKEIKKSYINKENEVLDLGQHLSIIGEVLNLSPTKNSPKETETAIKGFYEELQRNIDQLTKKENELELKSELVSSLESSLAQIKCELDEAKTNNATLVIEHKTNVRELKQTLENRLEKLQEKLEKSDKEHKKEITRADKRYVRYNTRVRMIRDAAFEERARIRKVNEKLNDAHDELTNKYGELKKTHERISGAHGWLKAWCYITAGPIAAGAFLLAGVLIYDLAAPYVSKILLN